MTTKHIGDFGIAHDDHVELTFGYFGKTLRVQHDAGELSYLDFMDRAFEVDEEDQKEGIKVTMSYLKMQVHPDDWEEFWTLARTNRQSLENLMMLSRNILEAVAGFPTPESSDSPPTPPSIVPKSRGVSSRQAKGRAIEKGPSVDGVQANADKAMVILKGRPDLQAAVQRATEREYAGAPSED